MPKRIPQIVANRIIEAYNNGSDFIEVAKILKINFNSARTIIRRYELNKDDNTPKCSHGGARNIKVTNEMKIYLNSILDSNSMLTLKEMKFMLLNQYPEHPISISTVAHCLNGMLFTTKKVTDIPIQRNSDVNKEIRYNYAQWFLMHAQRRIIVYIDEMGFNVRTRRTYGRSKIGTNYFEFLQSNEGRT